MYKNSFYSLIIALIIPLVGYIVLYASTYKKIQMPPKYFVDTIITKTEKGKTIDDTIFHQIQTSAKVVYYPITQKRFNLGDLVNNQVALYYFATHKDTFTSQNLKQLSYLKKQLKIDSFINIICFVNTTLPDSFLLPNIHFIQFQDTLQQKAFFKDELKLNIHTQMLPFVVLVDKQNIVRNYYLLNHLDEEKILLDIILVNLEKGN